MFEFFLSLRKSGTRLRLGVAWTSRVLTLVFALASACATFAYGDIPPLGLVLTLVLVFLVLYEESWTFDKESGACTSRLGLVFANRQKTLALADLESVTVSRFVKGSPGHASTSPTPAPGTMVSGAGHPDSAQDGSPASSASKPGFFQRRYQRSVTRLCLVTLSGETLTLETGSTRNNARLESTGQALAAWLGLPFRQE